MKNHSLALVRDEAGATTAEYATVTGCGVGFAAVLFKFLTSDAGQQLLKFIFDAIRVSAAVLTHRPTGEAAGAVRLAGHQPPALEEQPMRAVSAGAPNPSRAGEQGAVTAETAMALPMIAIFAVSMAWLVSLGLTQVRAQDAAREAARAAARGDGAGDARARSPGGPRRFLDPGTPRVRHGRGRRCPARCADRPACSVTGHVPGAARRRSPPRSRRDEARGRRRHGAGGLAHGRGAPGRGRHDRGRGPRGHPPPRAVRGPISPRWRRPPPSRTAVTPVRGRRQIAARNGTEAPWLRRRGLGGRGDGGGPVTAAARPGARPAGARPGGPGDRRAAVTRVQTGCRRCATRSRLVGLALGAGLALVALVGVELVAQLADLLAVGSPGGGALGAAAEHPDGQHEQQQGGHAEEEDHGGVGLEVEGAEVERGRVTAAEEGGEHQQDGDEQDDQCGDEHAWLPCGSDPRWSEDRLHATAPRVARRSSRRSSRRDGAGLVERVVLVAALGGLHARRAALGAGAVRDRLAGGREPGAGGPEAALAEPCPARVAVVHEHGELAGVGVQGGGDAADVPPVAGREQREQPDRGVLGGVGGSGQVGVGEAVRREQARGQRPPHRRGAQLALGQVEQLLADHLARGHPALEEGHHLVADPHLAEAQPGRSPRDVLPLAEDLDVGDLAGRGRVVGVGALEDGHRLLEVERGDQPGLALVQVDRAGVGGAVGGGVVDGAEHPAGDVLDQPDGGAAGGADVGEVAGAAPVGPEPAARSPAQQATLGEGVDGGAGAGSEERQVGRGSAATRRPRRTGGGRARRGCRGRRRWPRPGGPAAPPGGGPGRCPAGRRAPPSPRAPRGPRDRPGRPAATAPPGCRGSRRAGRRRGR